MGRNMFCVNYISSNKIRLIIVFAAWLLLLLEVSVLTAVFVVCLVNTNSEVVNRLNIIEFILFGAIWTALIVITNYFYVVTCKLSRQLTLEINRRTDV